MASGDIKEYHVIISGAGMVGLSTAIGLAKIGLSVAILEKHSLPDILEPRFDGRVCAISLGSKRILESIGAWEYMQEYAEPILDIRVTDGATPFFCISIIMKLAMNHLAISLKTATHAMACSRQPPNIPIFLYWKIFL